MPQMAPINWLILFITFTITYLMFNIMNYFMFNPQLNKTKKNKTSFHTSINWKW